MASIKIRERFTIDGVLTNVTSVVLNDPTSTYGVKRNDTDAVVVAAGTPLVNVSTGVYEYEFEEPASGLTYTYWIEYVYSGNTYRVERSVTGGIVSGNYITESDVDNWPEVVSYTEEFTTDDVDLENDRIKVEKVISTGSLLRFNSTGTLPAPLVIGMAYYAISDVGAAVDYIKVATTPINAAAGECLDITDVGSGTHTLNVGEGISSSDKQAIIDKAEQLIERITRDYFYEKSFIIYRDGNDSDKLSLGLVPDVLLVSEIKVSGVELATSWWTYNADSVYLNPEAAVGDEEDLAELHLRLKYKRRLFPKGMGNIKITGTHGWSSCPPAIKRTAIILCRAENDPTLYPSYSSQVESESLGDYSYTLADDTGTFTGIDPVDRLLKHHIRRKPTLSAI